jgi:UDP-glucose 6-dehydrogenase
MRKDGSADIRIVESVLDELSEIPGDRIAVVKSTIPPGTTKIWNAKYRSSGLTVVFNPEFLTEANAIDDMREQNRIIIGGPRPASTIVKQVFSAAFPNVTIVKTGSTEAEFVKYFTNCFLATKVSFANEMKQICDAINIDYDKVVEYTLHDERIGDTHLTVPGPDGSLGFGGHCVPGDSLISAMYLSYVIPGSNGADITDRDIHDVYEGKVTIEELYELFHSMPPKDYFKIKSANPGCKSLTRGGKRVSDVTRNDFEGELIVFDIGRPGENILFKCTPEHLMPIKRDGQHLIVKAEDVLETDILFTVESTAPKFTLISS